MKNQAHLTFDIFTYDKLLCYGCHLDDEIVCIGVFLQGIYAVVEFANRESITSLLERAAIPHVSHESVVPFKSRLLSLNNLSQADSPNQQFGQQCQPQTTPPINELIQRLSKEESVSRVSYTEVHFGLKNQHSDLDSAIKD